MAEDREILLCFPCSGAVAGSPGVDGARGDMVVPFSTSPAQLKGRVHLQS